MEKDKEIVTLLKTNGDFYKVYNLKSKDVNVDGTPKLPNSDILNYGEIAINYKHGIEVISIKNSRNEIVTFDSTNNDNIVNMDRRFKLETDFYTPDQAHRAIPLDLRKFGLIIYYKVEEKKYKFEQFVGNNLEDWALLENWSTINDVIDNLESHATDIALSANQGRILNERLTFLDQTLLPLQISTSVNPSGLSKMGNEIDVKFSWNIFRKGYLNLQMDNVYINGIKQDTPIKEITYKLSNSRTIEVMVESSGLSVIGNITKSFAEAIYSGLVDEGFVFNENSIKKYEVPTLQLAKSFNKNLGTVNHKVAFYAYPSNRGSLTKVTDGNGYDISDLYKTNGNWNLQTINITINRKPIKYNIYTSEVFDTEKDVIHKFI